MDDTLPSAIGERVKPVISEEMLKKFAAITKGKENKAKKQMNISGSDVSIFLFSVFMKKKSLLCYYYSIF